jgi:hypothetical protein
MMILPSPLARRAITKVTVADMEEASASMFEADTTLALQDSQTAVVFPHSTAPGTLARLATGLCHFHWAYVEKARQCEQPRKCGN